MRTLSLTIVGLTLVAETRARAGGSACGDSGGSGGRRRLRRPRLKRRSRRARPTPPSRRASPTTRRAGAIRSSACCGAGRTRNAGPNAWTRPRRPRRRRRSRLRGTLHERRRLRRASSRAPTRRPTSCASGTGCLDGTIRSIIADAMVILQQVNDPLSLEKQREVRKTLRQTEEAK